MAGYISFRPTPMEQRFVDLVREHTALTASDVMHMALLRLMREGTAYLGDSLTQSHAEENPRSNERIVLPRRREDVLACAGEYDS